MSDIIGKMRKSSNKLLETEARDFAMWSKLKHNKSDLELFLNYNIAEISFKKKNGKMTSVICTSNTALAKVMSAKKKKDKLAASKLKSDGIHTRDSLTIDTWDIVSNKLKTISLASWQIMNFISITEENILLLDELMNDVLKRKYADS